MKPPSVSPPPSSDPQPILSPNDAANVLAVDLRNILTRAKAGKTLTASQRQLIQNLSAGEAASKLVTKSRSELADVLGIHRNTLARFEKQSDAPKPSSNGERDVGAWREWLKKTGKAAATGDRKTELEEQRLALIIESLTLDNQIRRREFISVEEVRQNASTIGQRIKTDLLGIPDALAQTLAGLSPAEISQRLREAILDALRHLSENS